MSKYSVIVFCLLLFASCKTINPNHMFGTVNESFQKDSTDSKKKEYIIAVGDRLDMHFYSIEGFKLVDVTNTSQGGTTGEAGVNYIVEEDGLVKLPIIGKAALTGMTLREAEKFLEEKYNKYYVNPFILLRVTNRHVYVFYEESGRGQMVNLVNDNTSIIEAIASAGGMTENSKAYRIKVIRGDLHNPKVFYIDLSTIEGMKQSNLAVQSSDIIYIESTSHYKQKLLTEIAPIVGIITSILLIVNLLKK